MNNLEVLREQNLLGKNFTMYGTIKNPLFLVKDVADWIEHSNVTMMLKGIDNSEKIVVTLPTKHSLVGLQGNTQYTFLTEDGLYEVLMLSRKPIAKEYKKEIKQILKTIRTTGGYVETDREEEFIEKYFPSFTEETKLTMVKDLRIQLQEIKKEVTKLKPQAEAYQDLMTANGYLQMIDVAKMVEIGRNKLFDFLRQYKVLTKQSTFNVPTQLHIDNGNFQVISTKTDKGFIKSVTMVSPKGLNYIYKLLKKKDKLDDFNSDLLLDLASVEVQA